MDAACGLSIGSHDEVVGFVQMKRPTARKSARRGYDRRYNENKIRVSVGDTQEKRGLKPEVQSELHRAHRHLG